MLERAGAPLGIVTDDRRAGARRGRRSRAAPIMPERRRWMRATTRSSRRPTSCSRVEGAAGPRNGGDGRSARGRARRRERRSGPRHVCPSTPVPPTVRGARLARRRDRLRAASPHRAGRDERRTARRALRGCCPGRHRARLRGRPRRGDPRRGRCADRNGLRPQPERRGQPLARRALERGRHRARDRRARRRRSTGSPGPERVSRGERARDHDLGRPRRRRPRARRDGVRRRLPSPT